MRRSDILMAMAQRLAQREEFEKLAQILAELPPAAAAEALTRLSPEQSMKAFDHLPLDLAADILAELPEEYRRELLELLGPDRIAEVMEEMPSDEATDVLQDMEPEEAWEVLSGLDSQTRAELAELASYNEETAGGIMAKEFAALPASMTAGEAIDVLRRNFQDVQDLNVVFAVDDEGRLVGNCSLRDIVLASPDTPLAELVARHEHWVRENQDQEEVAHYMRQHDLDAVAVVDEQGHVIGQITLDDAAEVMDEEAAEDLKLISGITGDERVFSPLLGSIVRRVPWLLINIPLALLAATVARLFSGTISAVPAVVAYLPIIGGIAGNAAGQTVSVFVRGIAVGEVTFADLWRSLISQARIGIVAGLLLGLVVAVVAAAWEGSLPFVIVVAVALALNCLVACLVGAFLPLALRRVGWDPAMGANLVTTSITDATGYAFLLGIMTIALKAGLIGS